MAKAWRSVALSNYSSRDEFAAVGLTWAAEDSGTTMCKALQPLLGWWPLEDRISRVSRGIEPRGNGTAAALNGGGEVSFVPESQGPRPFKGR
jgi:hypothetical protein